MIRPVLVGALLIAIGAAASFLVSSRDPELSPQDEPRTALSHAVSPRGFSALDDRADTRRHRSDLERRVKSLEARLVEEAAERRRLEAHLEAVSAQLAALGSAGVPDEKPAGATDSSSPPAAPAPPVTDPSSPPAIDYTKSATERALVAAGLDAATAADIKRRQDELVMTEMYLRDQATREQWLDTPRFNDEMAGIEAQRTSLRDEIGDDAYDRYLYALGHTNRVRVDDVLLQSPAAQVGLQAGDMIVSYGATRLFAPGDLVAQTRSGTAGEAVRLEIIRNGERLEVEVPRGPLGIRLAATQYKPEES